MNKAIIMGRLTADPTVTVANSNGEQITIARYTLAVDGRNNETDFLRVVAFRGNADFAEKYLKKGIKILVCGRIKTDSYKDKDGKTVYTTDIIAESQEFCEKKGETAPAPATTTAPVDSNGFMNIPDNIDEDLPFN